MEIYLEGRGMLDRRRRSVCHQKVTEYLQNLIFIGNEHGPKQEVGLFLPPRKKLTKVPILVSGKLKDSAWGVMVHDDDTSSGAKGSNKMDTKVAQGSLLT